MAKVLPFKGVRYNTDKMPDITCLVCPPYDVISPEAQEQYYERHAHNMIRVELGEDLPGDTPANNRYTRAATHLADWQKQRILVRDSEPSLYLYSMSYHNPREGAKTLKGFLALVRLEEPDTGQILPHEWTFPSAKQDRLQLLRACGANTSPIFMLYSYPENQVMGQLEKAVDENRPTYRVSGEDGILHQLWTVFDPKVQEVATERLKDQPLFIADGHHRYETALNYRKEMRARSQDRSSRPYDFVLVYCASMSDPGMSLLPIHRVVLNPLPLDIQAIRHKLSKIFSVSSLPFTESSEADVRARLFEQMERAGKTETVFAMYAEGEQRYELLRLRNPSDITVPMGRLDVTKFQRHVLEQVLGIENAAEKKETRLQFIKDAESAIQAVRTGTAGIAFFLNPTRVEQVREVVLSGDRMPQKSTYFYPKPLTGLVLNVFE